MATPVVTVASGGLPVVDVTASTPKLGLPVTEALNGRGTPVTKVAARGMPVTYSTVADYPAGGGTFVPSVLDPTTLTFTTLSGGGLIATNTATSTTACGARVGSASGRTTGKYYFEAVFQTLVGGAGCAVAITVFSSLYSQITGGGTGSTGVTVFPSGDMYASGGVVGAALGSLAANGVGMAVDLDTRKFWARNLPTGNWNGAAGADPATQTGGVTIPGSISNNIVPAASFGGTGGTAGNVTRFNFGATAFTGAVPAGFTLGWPQ